MSNSATVDMTSATGSICRVDLLVENYQPHQPLSGTSHKHYSNRHLGILISQCNSDFQYFGEKRVEQLQQLPCLQLLDQTKSSTLHHPGMSCEQLYQSNEVLAHSFVVFCGVALLNPMMEKFINELNFIINPEK